MRWVCCAPVTVPQALASHAGRSEQSAAGAPCCTALPAGEQGCGLLCCAAGSAGGVQVQVWCYDLCSAATEAPGAFPRVSGLLEVLRCCLAFCTRLVVKDSSGFQAVIAAWQCSMSFLSLKPGFFLCVF